jgi:hypothetical protein
LLSAFEVHTSCRARKMVSPHMKLSPHMHAAKRIDLFEVGRSPLPMTPTAVIPISQFFPPACESLSTAVEAAAAPLPSFLPAEFSAFVVRLDQVHAAGPPGGMVCSAHHISRGGQATTARSTVCRRGAAGMPDAASCRDRAMPRLEGQTPPSDDAGHRLAIPV